MYSIQNVILQTELILPAKYIFELMGLPQHIQPSPGRQSQSDDSCIFNVLMNEMQMYERWKESSWYLSEVLPPFLFFPNRHSAFTGVQHTIRRISCHLKKACKKSHWPSTSFNSFMCTFVGKEHRKSYLTVWLTTWQRG